MDLDDDKTRLPGSSGDTADSSADRYASASTHVLPVGTRLGEFEVVDLIGEGGFGIVYLAFDHSLERHVAVKEYMPSGLVARNRDMHVTVTSPAHRDTFNTGLRSFINEARLLARFDSPALVKVFRFWEGNGTAYMAMPFYEGITVKQAFKTGSIIPTEQWIKAFLTHLFDAVETIHAAKCYHRDIAPDNILLLSDGRPVLLDFGAARRVITDRTQGPTAILKPGFAPIEQYADIPSLKQGPWTDVYALGALVYYLITGKAPAPAVSRIMHDDVVPAVTAGKGRYTVSFLAGLDRAMTVRPEQRLQNIAELRSALDISQEVPRTMPGAQLNASRDAASGVFADVATERHRGSPEQTPSDQGPRTLLREAETEPPLTLQRAWTSTLGDRRKLAWGAGLAVLVLGVTVGSAFLRHDKAVTAGKTSPARELPANPPAAATTTASNDGTAPAVAPPPVPKSEAPGEKGEQTGAVAARMPERPMTELPPLPIPVPSAPSDQVMWERVSALDNAEAYAAYLRQFPKGRYAAAAKARIAQFAATVDQATPPVTAGTIPAAPPPPAEKPPAKPVASPEEENLWRTVKNIDQPLAYESFLNRFPNGFHSSAARNRLAELARQPAPTETVASKPPAAPLPSTPGAHRPAQPDAGTTGPNGNQVVVNKEKPDPAKPVKPLPQAPQAQQPQQFPQSEPEAEPVAASKPTIRLPNQTLIGDFSMDPVTGQISGRGKIIFSNRDQFTGTLVRGMREGKGEFTWASGQYYKGDWQQNQPSGKGYMKFPNGNEYTGDMKNGVPEGMGTIVFSNGNRYTGSIKNGLPDGYGTHRYSTGDVHTGNWSKGKSDGFGRYSWANGDYWEGQFKDDKQTENGKTVHVNAGGGQPAIAEAPRKAETESLSQQSGTPGTDKAGN